MREGKGLPNYFCSLGCTQQLKRHDLSQAQNLVQKRGNYPPPPHFGGSELLKQAAAENTDPLVNLGSALKYTL